MSTNNQKPCECTSCASALSPAGYLIALIDFVEEYLGKDENDLFIGWMRRPDLSKNPVGCDLIEEPVSQIQIANKVLREYIHKKVNLDDNGRSVYDFVAGLSPPFFYEATRFKEYLTALGTTIEEIHFTFADPDDSSYKSERLAELLGISHCELETLNRSLLTHVLGITVGDMVDLFELLNFTDLSQKEIERIYAIIQIGNDIGLSCSEISKFVTDQSDTALVELLNLDGQTELDALKRSNNPSIDDLTGVFNVSVEDVEAILSFMEIEPNGSDIPELNGLYRLSTFARGLGVEPHVLVNLMDKMQPRINDLRSLDNIEDVWKFIKRINSSGIEIEEFTLLRLAIEREQLAERLGKTLVELNDILIDPSEEKLAEFLGISQEYLNILFSMEIKDDTVELNNASAINTRKRLELLHRPIRLAQALGINLQELKALLDAILPDDTNVIGISYSQILDANEVVSLSRLLGLNLLELPEIIKSLSKEELEASLGFSSGEWDSIYLRAANDQERITLLSKKLSAPLEDIEALVQDLNPDLSSPQDVDKVRRIVRLSQQLGMNPQELNSFIASLPHGNLSILDINSLPRVFALAVAPKSLVKLISIVDELNDFTDINSCSRVYWLYRIDVLARSLGISLEDLKRFNKWEHEIDEDDVNHLLSVLESKYGARQLEKELKKPDERIWLKTREALLRCAISSAVATRGTDPKTIKELSNHLLIDLENSPCNITTEIQQAIESIQSFVIRVRTGQEDTAQIDEQKRERMEKEWRWMRRYTLWEASQKVFLYPENYIMPQLRDNKTPFFTELEDELSQGEVTNGLAKKAISSYVDKLHSISALRVSGTVYDESTKLLHIFARSQINEKETYYRTFKDQMVWSPWVKLEAEIESDRVYPLIAYNRIYIFWIETEEEKNDDTTKYKHKLSYCYTIEEGKWSKSKTHDLSLENVSSPILEVSVNDNDPITIVAGETGGSRPVTYQLACNDSLEKSKKNKEFDYYIATVIPACSEPSGNCGTDLILLKIPSANSDADLINNRWQRFHVKATISDKALVNCRMPIANVLNLAYNDTTLRFLWGCTRTILPGWPHYEVTDHTVLETIDDTFKIDDAIEIEDNTYFFCSDQYRCLMIVAHITFSGKPKELGPSFSICQLNYGKYCNLADKLYREGIDAFYDSDFQTDPLEPDFDSYTPNRPEVVRTPPTELEFQGPNKMYNWELFFHIPHLIADGLNQNRKFEAARDWYHYIFNPYSEGPAAEWKFAPFQKGVIDQLSSYINDPEDAAVWLEDPYNPHTVARVRPGAYQKAIILSYVENLLDWADQEFTRDTRESLNRAIGYYNTARRLLKLEEIEHDEPCHMLVISLRTTIGSAVSRARAQELLDKLSLIVSLPQEEIEELNNKVQDIAYSLYSEEIRTDKIDSLLDSAIEKLESLPGSTLSEIMEQRDDEVESIMNNVEDYINPMPIGPSAGVCIPEDWRSPEEQVFPPIRLLTSSMVGCVPENPIFQNFRNHIDSNLRKIHSCRNIAGVQRILPIYEASVDPMAIVKAVGSGAGAEALNFSNAAGIGPYRFAYLIERAKALANLVVQAGNALLLAIEKKESEELAYLRAQQELGLTKANVHLRKLGVVEAGDYILLTEKQTKRAKKEFNHYKGLIERELSSHEKDALNLLGLSIDWLTAAEVAHVIAAVLQRTQAMISIGATGGVQGWGTLGGAAASAAAAFSTQASIESTLSSLKSMRASFERREEEWGLRKDLAEKDKEISIQNEKIAADRKAIAEMEQQIAEMTAENADQMLEFLKEKFTNRELYVWMMKTLSKLLYGFYNLAYTNARMAQATLEFERNETLDFISYEYWDSEKKGLLSGDRLLLDINKLDDHYIQNNARKLEITKHISLAAMAPEAIIALKSNGVTTFATPMIWFDRDFPGHYQRIIKSVKVTALALVGPVTGINATLSTVCPSRVVLDPENPVLNTVDRIQSVALSAPANATGLFELNYRDERYLPFEGCGVDVNWELEMPKASNRFDFNTIVDVIMSIDYTALSDSEYKKTVITGLTDTGTGGMLPLSVRMVFPDAWYHFNNPIWLKPPQGGDDSYVVGNTPKPYSMKLVVDRTMFPPNEEDHFIEHVAFRFSLADSNIRVPFGLKYTSETGQTFERSNLRTGEDGYFDIVSGIKGLSPFGTWEIYVDRDNAELLWVKKDGSFVKDPYENRHVLDTEKITDVILAITYNAKLEWPPETET